MSGMALELFKSRDPGVLKTELVFPYLHLLVEKEILLPIDLHFVLRLFPNSSEEGALLIALLLAISREGHLCLKIEETISPPLLFCGDEREKIEEKIRCAFALIPEKSAPNYPFYRFKQSLYLQKNWLFETKFVAELQRLSATQPALAFSGAVERGSLNEEQVQAVESVLSHSLTLITGGPGTGKTFTAATIISHLLKIIDPEQIVIAAPTGKAAARMTASLKKQITAPITCTTLHALLNFRSSEELENEKRHLLADLVIIDECSMLDAPLFSSLLAAIKTGARLVLMGDREQLPPVNTGSLFADLVEAKAALSCITLRRSLRTEQKEILTLSHAIQQGDSEKVEKQVMPIEEESRATPKIAAHFAALMVNTDYPESILESMDQFRLLSPLRDGPYGVDQLNQRIANYLEKTLSKDQDWAIPIIITRTDPRLKLYNGETGILLRGAKEARAYFSEGRSFSAATLPPYEYAYCLSVHKSQGSEYDEVHLFLPPGAEVFGRELLYTAVTRARKRVVIEGSSEIVYKIMERTSRKVSGLQERLTC